ncbi:MAG TPA: TonB-dependent receptor [Ohtaekwangia sp.]|uniref:SusC/RagA family TonB-linked outer membrane protein n=1 Tax=Ohtaekwangia sp. TaxID=2066019 RepID=UPI002F956398
MKKAIPISIRRLYLLVRLPLQAVFLLACILLANKTAAQSEQVTVKGTVIDYASNLPLAGATVLAEGTTNGVTTDAHGAYTIDVPANAVLVFTFVGYDTEKASVNNRSTIDISLIPSLEILTQVVVVGYGEQKKTDITGSVSSLSHDAYKDQPIVTPSAALQGRIAGVSVQTVSGAPGGEVKIRVRGMNSINSSNDPLYVVDGIALFSAGLSDINVNDIESIEVLKDASATSIYGSRGSNGVVLITTKKGKADHTKIEYNSFVSFSTVRKKYDLIDAVGYAKLVNHIAGSTVFSDPDALAGTGTDWQDAIFRTSVTQSHQLSASGGTEKARYYISGYYVNQPGLVINSGQKKYAFRSNIDAKLSEKINLNVGLFVSHQQSHNTDDPGDRNISVITPAISWGPTEKIYSSPGVYNRTSSIGFPITVNPYLLAKERSNDATTNAMILNSTIKYDITDWLSYDLVLGVNANLGSSAYLYNHWISPTNPSSGQSSSQSYTLQNSNIVTFHKMFNDIHDVKLTGVVEETSSNYKSIAANGGGLTSETNGYYNLALNKTQSISSDYSNWGLLSYVGRLSYVLKDKYLFMATYRVDGSSKFQGSNKWGYFPSVAAGWRLSEESFIKELNIFTNLKLRGSYGKTGNQAVTPYSTLGLLDKSQFSYGTTTIYPGYTVGNPSNPNLKWETTVQTNVGLEMAFLNGKINVTTDYYVKNTKDLLLNKPIPLYDGGGSMLVNLGKVQNKGLEVTVNGSIIDSEKLSWTAGFNVTSYRNKVISLGGDDIINLEYLAHGLINTNIQVVKVGQPLGAFYLIPWQGVYQQNDGTHTAGEAKYEDVSGNGTIGYEDRKIVGSSTPKFLFGINNNLRYRNLELNIFIQGSEGNKVFNAVYADIAASNSTVKYPTLAAAANYWTPENTGSTFADPASANKTQIESTQFLQNGSYVRLKNISLSYSLPKDMLKFANLKLTVSAQNLLTLTHYIGFDPEITSTGLSTTGTSDAYGGLDVGAYPTAKSFSVGLQAIF